jgi:hypothetical protein
LSVTDAGQHSAFSSVAQHIDEGRSPTDSRTNGMPIVGDRFAASGL